MLPTLSLTPSSRMKKNLEQHLYKSDWNESLRVSMCLLSLFGYLQVYGGICESLGLCESLWVSLDLGLLGSQSVSWVSLGICRSRKVFVGISKLCGSLWVSLGFGLYESLCESLRDSVGLWGSLWESMNIWGSLYFSEGSLWVSVGSFVSL